MQSKVGLDLFYQKRLRNMIGATTELLGNANDQT